MSEYTGNRVILDSNIRCHFDDMLRDAMRTQSVTPSEETTCYLNLLLVSFLESRSLFTDTEFGMDTKPLAYIFCEAAQSPTSDQRNRLMKQLGDLSLFVSGIFGGSLSRKLVDVDYYISMGGSAYHYLSDASGGSPQWGTQREIFAELSEGFHDFVDVLTEFSESANLRSDSDTLNLYETWLTTGSKRAERKLRDRGIEPVRSSTATHH